MLSLTQRNAIGIGDIWNEHAVILVLLKSHSMGSFCNQNQGLSTCHHKNQTHETGAGKQEIDLFRCRQLVKMGDSGPKAHLDISVQVGGLWRGRGKSEQRYKEEEMWMCRQCPCMSQYGSLISAYWNWSVLAKFLWLGNLCQLKL